MTNETHEIYILDGSTIISESYDSIEAILSERGAKYYQFIDILMDGQEIRLNKGVDY